MKKGMGLIGHQKQLAKLVRADQTGALANAYLLAGPRGIGKAQFAKHFFALALCEASNACGICPPCRQLAVGSQVDCHIIGGEEAAIKIEAIRHLQQQLSQTSVSKIRFVLLEDCERLTLEAANALLKLLEESPPATSLFLTTSQLAEILPTVRSRCRIITFQDLAPAELKAGLVQLGFAPEDVQACLNKLSYLRPGELINCLENPDYQAQKLLLQEEVEQLWARPGLTEGLCLTEKYAASADLAREFLLTVLRISHWQLKQGLSAAEIQQRVQLAARAQQGLQDLVSNVNRKLVLDNLILSLTNGLK